MQSKSIWHYMYFGTTFYYLQRATTRYSIHKELGVLQNIDRFFERLSEFRFVVTERAAQELRDFRDELAQAEKDKRLTEAEAVKLGRIMANLRPTLQAEAEGKVAYIVTDKRLDVNKLLLDIRSLMAPGVYDALTDIAQYDFREAGKCLAFELPTSAAFHLLRGTEAVLRAFYLYSVKRNRISNLLWGSVVTALRNRRNPPPEPLLDNLDNIRRSFRNPTQHPEKIYDIQEAQDLFALCVDVVNRMILLMK